jgi:hypothetical protein
MQADESHINRENPNQQAKTIFNIGNITEATFVDPSNPKYHIHFNRFLTKHLIYGISHFNRNAAALLESAEQNEELDWERSEEYGDSARDILISAFVGPVSIQLRKLMAIGKNEDDEKAIENYVKTGISAARQALELVCFALLSSLEVHLKKHYRPIHQETIAPINNFFESPVERTLTARVRLLQALYKAFSNLRIPFPIPDLARIQSDLEDGSTFCTAFRNLQAIDKLTHASTLTTDHCLDIEKNLSLVLTTLNFLAQYRMASLKRITVDCMRNRSPRYVYSVAEIRSEKASENYEIDTFEDEHMTTDSVILFNGDIKKGINLFPFIIDEASLSLETGANIAFFSARDTEGDMLIFRLLYNDEKYLITPNPVQPAFETQDSHIPPDIRRQLKRDMVNTLFKEAQITILGHD